MLRALPRAAGLEFEELERTTAGALSASDRPLKELGHLALWANLGAGLYLMIVGASMVPALSIAQAALATLLGAALGAALVAITVRLASAENRSGVLLCGEALGERGAGLYGALALFRHLAWGAIQLAIAAQMAAAVAGRQGLGGGQPLWAVLFGALVLYMVLAGPVGMTRAWLVRVGGPLVALIAVGFALSAWSDYGIPAFLQREPATGWPTMTAAVDIAAALALIWLPVAADLGRLGGPRRSGMAAFLGLGVMTAWFVLLGVLFVPAVSGEDLPGFLLATPLGALAILVVLVLELDGAFVSLYALATTARGLSARVEATPVVLAGAGLFVLGGALLDPFDYGDTMLLLGAAFAPLLGVLLGIRAARRLSDGARLPLGGLLAWALGFMLYNWAAPLAVPAWSAAMSAVLHDFLRLPFPAGVPGLSATLLAFVASFVLAGVGALAGGAVARSRPAEASAA